ncbi:FAD-dependent oxidoreductase [Nesterenkonia pannonica]|uniref:FAD-dependent oxidoreductase n=1 Tax=Nesterenkonia pannonica TaxID=1548602 RepID=UPI0021649601|nr:FAD-dependent oxidoreductase [Nesterenkonia pannonica]
MSLQFELAEPLLPQDRSTFGPGTMLGWFAEQSRTTFADSRGRVSIVCTEPEAHRGTDSWELAKQAFEEADRLGLDLRHKMLDFRKIVMPEDFYPPKPGNDAKRPKQRTSINGLVLAGDYTAQKYLGTMEGAVVSGQLAAQAAMAQELSGRVAEPSNLM